MKKSPLPHPLPANWQFNYSLGGSGWDITPYFDRPACRVDTIGLILYAAHQYRYREGIPPQ